MFESLAMVAVLAYFMFPVGVFLILLHYSLKAKEKERLLDAYRAAARVGKHDDPLHETDNYKRERRER